MLVASIDAFSAAWGGVIGFWLATVIFLGATRKRR